MLALGAFIAGSQRTGRVASSFNEDLAEWLQYDFDGPARYIVRRPLTSQLTAPARITAETASECGPFVSRETKITLPTHNETT
jgi:hypothetical protein